MVLLPNCINKNEDFDIFFVQSVVTSDNINKFGKRINYIKKNIRLSELYCIFYNVFHKRNC